MTRLDDPTVDFDHNNFILRTRTSDTTGRILLEDLLRPAPRFHLPETA
ncbi:MAG: hypothetical protein WA824_15840 [Candidatus Sulfotelmatobacter sp.]